MTSVQEVADSLVPNGQVVAYRLGNDDLGYYEFRQRPLSFFGKIELFGVLGSAVEKAIKNGGVSISEFLGDGPATLDRVSEADSFIAAIARLAQEAPDFLSDLYVIALSVPKGEREFVKAVMELHADDGGLSDEDGMKILNTFIDQNWEALRDFFALQLMPLVTKLMNSQPDQESESSKPSKATARTTRKQ